METTIVLNQSAGYTPDPTQAAWENDLGGRALALPAGTQINVSSAVIDVGGNDDASSYVFLEDISERIEFHFWVWSSSINSTIWLDATAKDASICKIGKVRRGNPYVPDSFVDVGGEFTVTVPAGKYSASGLCDIINRQTIQPTDVPRGVTTATSDGALVNAFYRAITHISATDNYQLLAIDGSGDTLQLTSNTTYLPTYIGSSQGLNCQYDSVTSRCKLSYLHTPLVSTSGPEVAYEKPTAGGALTAIGARTGIAVHSWTDKASWSDTLWARMGFTQQQLAGIEDPDFGFYTQQAMTTALTAVTDESKATFSASKFNQPLTAAYDASGVDRSFAEGNPVNALSAAWNIRIPQLRQDWRRDKNGEGSIARVTRSFASAGFVYGQGARTYVLTSPVLVQTLSVEILGADGEISTELGQRNSVTLEISAPDDESEA